MQDKVNCSLPMPFVEMAGEIWYNKKWVRVCSAHPGETERYAPI